MSGLGIAAQHLHNTFLLWISKTIAPHYTIIPLLHWIIHIVLYMAPPHHSSHIYTVYIWNNCSSPSPSHNRLLWSSGIGCGWVRLPSLIGNITGLLFALSLPASNHHHPLETENPLAKSLMGQGLMHATVPFTFSPDLLLNFGVFSQIWWIFPFLVERPAQSKLFL